MTKNKQLKIRIRDRFGSVAEFARLTGFDRWALINALNDRVSSATQKATFAAVDKLLTETPRVDLTKDKISIAEREYIRQVILIKFRSARNFCKIFEDFSPAYISKVINGHKILKDDRFNNLINQVQIEESSLDRKLSKI